MPSTQSPKSMTARTFERLREAIVNADHHPGEKLRIDTLSKELGASSGAIREALSRLTAEGLVVAEPQKGFVVSPISRQDLLDLTEVRIDIEVRCLNAAIAEGDIDWESRLISLAHQFSSLSNSVLGTPTGPTRDWHNQHEAYHRALASGCKNEWWLRLREQLYVQSERYRRLSSPFEEGGRDVASEHQAITTAVLNKDAKVAGALLTAHLQATTDILLASPIPFSDIDL